MQFHLPENRDKASRMDGAMDDSDTNILQPSFNEFVDRLHS